MSLLITHMVSASSTTTAAVPSPQTVSSDIANRVQEMQQARYFTFVMLVRMVQKKIPHNTTFLMPSGRLMSTASISQSQVLEFLSRHSITAPLKFNDLIRLPNGTSFRCHGINRVIRPTAARRVKGATCTRYAAPTSAAPEIPLAENQSLSTSSLRSPNTGYATIPAHEPAAESSQCSDTSMSKTRLAGTTLVTALMISIF
ncbi:hypothetical protein PAHAL_3G063800 [Panicum hallii]|uniref:FAS1 domain-containing protein n=1 Tax=Panicum hallii TaxID=206008 RepID=A0A2S3H6L0_9POAL|nr:hypothetical protein PAHAL_3G063800 [Panicum hallii]